jgi:hypothetical protein
VSDTETGPQPAVRAGPDKTLLAVIGGAALLVVAAIVAVLVLKAPPMGYLLIEVPPDATQVEVNVNGQKVTEKDGSPVTSWPHLHAVPAGTVNVLIKSKEYKPHAESVVVKEGGEYAKLTKHPQKN